MPERYLAGPANQDVEPERHNEEKPEGLQDQDEERIVQYDRQQDDRRNGGGREHIVLRAGKREDRQPHLRPS